MPLVPPRRRSQEKKIIDLQEVRVDRIVRELLRNLPMEEAPPLSIETLRRMREISREPFPEEGSVKPKKKRKSKSKGPESEN